MLTKGARPTYIAEESDGGHAHWDWSGVKNRGDYSGLIRYKGAKCLTYALCVATHSISSSEQRLFGPLKKAFYGSKRVDICLFSIASYVFDR